MSITDKQKVNELKQKEYYLPDLTSKVGDVVGQNNRDNSFSDTVHDADNEVDIQEEDKDDSKVEGEADDAVFTHSHDSNSSFEPEGSRDEEKL